MESDDATGRRQLEERLRELQLYNQRMRREAETGAVRIKELNSAIVTGLETAERKEERLTNAMAKKLKKLEADRAKLEEHLVKEEESKRVLERRLRRVESDNRKLKDTLKAEETQILQRLRRPLSVLRRQTEELAKRVSEEAELDALLSQMEQLRDEFGAVPASGGDIGDLLDVASETASASCPPIPRRNSNLSLTTASTAETPCEAERKPRGPSLTSQSLKQLQTENASRDSLMDSIVHEVALPDAQQAVAIPIGSFAVSDRETPKMGPQLPNPQAQVRKLFSPLPNNCPAYPAMYQVLPVSVDREVSSPVSSYDEGEHERSSRAGAGGECRRTASVRSLSSSLADDASMIQQLQREIKRLAAWQAAANEKSAAYEERIRYLQREIQKAQVVNDAEAVAIGVMSDRLARTNSLANEMSAQNEALEWSTDRCSLNSSVLATPRPGSQVPRADSEASTPVQGVPLRLVAPAPNATKKGPRGGAVHHLDPAAAMSPSVSESSPSPLRTPNAKPSPALVATQLLVTASPLELERSSLDTQPRSRSKSGIGEDEPTHSERPSDPQ